jgi:hypothetical protein
MTTINREYYYGAVMRAPWRGLVVWWAATKANDRPWIDSVAYQRIAEAELDECLSWVEAAELAVSFDLITEQERESWEEDEDWRDLPVGKMKLALVALYQKLDLGNNPLVDYQYVGTFGTFSGSTAVSVFSAGFVAEDPMPMNEGFMAVFYLNAIGLFDEPLSPRP